MIEITARLLVSKKDLQAAGVDTEDDFGLAMQANGWLSDRLPESLKTDQLTVGIRRKVKPDAI